MNGDYRELRKSATNKTLSGVCGGLGEYLKIDPTVIRLLWVVLTCVSAGLGLVGYFIAAVIIPDALD